MRSLLCFRLLLSLLVVDVYEEMAKVLTSFINKLPKTTVQYGTFAKNLSDLYLRYWSL